MNRTTAAGGLWLGVLGAILIGIDFSLALLQTHVEQKWLTAVEGQSVTLPVWYSSSSEEKPYITWFIQRAKMEQVQILKYMDGVTDVDGEFKGRLDFVYAMPSKNVSIVINRTLSSDAGEYRCYINIRNDQSAAGGNIGVIGVSILVPPAKPRCRLQGDPYIGANVTLSCWSSSGRPIPKYSWIKKASRASSDLRFFQPNMDPVKGTLTLTNLTTANSGTYSCTSSNTAAQAMCDITMEVTSAWRTAIIVGAVIGSIVGLCCLAILIAVLLCLYRRQKKEAQDELANDIKEDAPAPKTLTWAKGNDSDLVSKNGTLSSTNSHHHHHKPYPPKSPSDTTSINTAAGSGAPYRPPDKGRITTPTPSLSSQSMPTYMAPANGNYYTTAVPTDRGATPQANGVDKQSPGREVNATAGVTASNLMRMGAVPVMVPAQSQAGSLV